MGRVRKSRRRDATRMSFMKTNGFCLVMAGLVPAIPSRGPLCLIKRDARHKAGHDAV
jgi:hypothetical protein